MNSANMAVVIFKKHDPESTNLKYFDVNDNISQPPRCKRSNQRKVHLSGSSNYYQPETDIPLLPRPHSSSYQNNAIAETDYLQTADSVTATQQYYNLRNKVLPPFPPETSSDGSGSSSSRSASCSSCGCSGHSIRQEKRFLKGHYLICITVASVLFSIASCSISTLGFFYKTSTWERTAFKEGAYETCIPCVQLSDTDGISSDLESQLTMKIRDGESVCCASTSGQMSALVQMMMNQNTVNVLPTPAQTGFRFSPVSAHKHLHPWSSDEAEEPQFQDKHYHLKLSPSIEVSAEHARHVTAKNNSLEIQFSGWYLVYSSVYFKPRTDKLCGHLRHQTWGHFINRKSPTRRSTSGTLAQSAHTCCDNCADDHHTSYTAGVFMLEAGDDIYVEVSGSGLVLFDGDGSYLGLVMLGSWDPPKTQG